MSAGGVDAPPQRAKRDATTQALVDAAKVMPGTADPDPASDPDETPESEAAERPVVGRRGTR